MIHIHDPSTVHPPLGRYTHAIELAGDVRLLFISGQIGVKPDGKLADGTEGQLSQIWENISAILIGANMTLNDIVRVMTFITRPEHFSVHTRVRGEFLGKHRATATGVCISSSGGTRNSLRNRSRCGLFALKLPGAGGA